MSVNFGQNKDWNRPLFSLHLTEKIKYCPFKLDRLPTVALYPNVQSTLSILSRMKLGNNVLKNFSVSVKCKRKRKRSDSDLWQKPLHQKKCQKGKVTTQTTPQKVTFPFSVTCNMLYVTNFGTFYVMPFGSIFIECTWAYIVPRYLSLSFCITGIINGTNIYKHFTKEQCNCPQPCEYTRYDTTLSCGRFPAAFLEPYFSKAYNISKDKFRYKYMIL